MPESARRLDAGEIAATVERLCLRIGDRFPDSGLLRVCGELHALACEAGERVRWISRPNWLFRLGIYLLVAFILFATAYSLWTTPVGISEPTALADLIQVGTSAMEGLALVAAGLLSLLTVENRIKRTRVTAAVNDLRSLAHVIDAHQLTKDPDVIRHQVQPSAHSPKRTMTLGDLRRYLNYCSEMLSLTSKVGFLYVQNFPDPVSTETVNDLEALTTGLSRKVWQKILLSSPGQPPAGSV